jgi:hypothetical protein
MKIDTNFGTTTTMYDGKTTDKFKKNLRFDSRLIEWNLKHKILQDKELKDHSTQIPDSSGNVETFAVDDIA